ncbi:T9SS type A sorting domain-containing protein [Rasiella sp. SM2506]|uniref:T9SS type A sorting domain-containing protein n=1 Tax=Rasiella sp. SM2506 TaxID=3423914 RepID=UPI003D7AEA87
MKYLFTLSLFLIGIFTAAPQDCTTAATIPYTEDFSAGTPECWDYENTDTSNPVWTYNNAVDITGNGTNDPVLVLIPPSVGVTQKNDWAFTKKLAFTAGTEYLIEVDYNAFNLGNATASENFELVITDAPSSTATFNTVIGTYSDFIQQGEFPGSNNGNDIKTLAYTASETFTPATSGDFYVAIHALGSNGTEGGGFFLFNTSITENAPGCTAASIPYFEDFGAGDPPCFVIEDTDNIAPVWSYNNSVDIDGDGTNDPVYSNISPGVQFSEKDDWVFSRAVQLEAGTTYYFSSHYNAVDLGNGTSIENFELWVLDAQSSTAPFQQLLNTYNDIFQQGEFPGNNTGNDLEAQAYLAEEGFTPTTSGEYYLGVHAIDATVNGGALLLFDVGVSDEPSEPLCIEPAMLPYSEDFSNGTPECWAYENTDTQAPEWAFNDSVDIDGDGTDDPIMTLIPNNVSQFEKDDWAFTKAISFVGGTNYRIEIDYNALNLGNIIASENFELVITDAQNSGAIVETLATYSDIVQQGEFPGANNGNDLESMAYTASELFTPTTTGEYYVAIHATGASGTDAGAFLLFDVNVSIDIVPSDGGLIILPTTGFVSTVNYNGSAAAGYDTQTHFLWDETTGFETIGGVVPAPGIGGKTGISDNGLTIGASSLNTTSGLIELSMYDVATQTWTPLGGLGGDDGQEASSSHAISGDASTIVGLGYTAGDNLPHAIRWTDAEGVIDLGSTVAGAYSRANATNLDGTVVGGWQDTATGFRQGAVWIDGVQQTIETANGDPIGPIETVSNDGVWAAGEGNFANNFQAYRWSEAAGVESIGPPLSPGHRGFTSGLNEDGSIAVGVYRPNGVPAIFGQGFIWTEATGIQNLNDYATSLGIDTQGVTLAFPLDISADGSTIVGSGKDSNNNTVGFVLKLAPTVLGVGEVSQVDSKISFYPNPVKDVLNIASTSLMKKAVVYSITGQVVLQKELSNTNNTLTLSGLNSGIYIVQVETVDNIQSFKFIKE